MTAPRSLQKRRSSSGPTRPWVAFACCLASLSSARVHAALRLVPARTDVCPSRRPIKPRREGPDLLRPEVRRRRRTAACGPARRPRGAAARAGPAARGRARRTRGTARRVPAATAPSRAATASASPREIRFGHTPLTTIASSPRPSAAVVAASCSSVSPTASSLGRATATRRQRRGSASASATARACAGDRPDARDLGERPRRAQHPEAVAGGGRVEDHDVERPRVAAPARASPSSHALVIVTSSRAPGAAPHERAERARAQQGETRRRGTWRVIHSSSAHSASIVVAHRPSTSALAPGAPTAPRRRRLPAAAAPAPGRRPRRRSRAARAAPRPARARPRPSSGRCRPCP